jgi:hypothetical protein
MQYLISNVMIFVGYVKMLLRYFSIFKYTVSAYYSIIMYVAVPCNTFCTSVPKWAEKESRIFQKTGVSGENHRPVAIHWQTVPHNVLGPC